MKRRAFLGTLTTLAAGFILDPEMALWRPGAKTIFLPTPWTPRPGELVRWSGAGMPIAKGFKVEREYDGGFIRVPLSNLQPVDGHTRAMSNSTGLGQVGVYTRNGRVQVYGPPQVQIARQFSERPVRYAALT